MFHSYWAKLIDSIERSMHRYLWKKNAVCMRFNFAMDISMIFSTFEYIMYCYLHPSICELANFPVKHSKHNDRSRSLYPYKYMISFQYARSACACRVLGQLSVSLCQRHQTEVILPVVRPRGRSFITVSNSLSIFVLASALPLSNADLTRSSFILAIRSSLVNRLLCR